MGTQSAPVSDVKTVRNEFLAGLALAVALAVLYAPVMKGLVIQWWDDPNYSHGFLVPLFAGFVLWRTRDKWLKLQIEPRNSGIWVIVAALGLLAAGSLGAELFLSRTSLIVLLAGIVLYLGGWKVLRSVAFPLGFLAFMIPLPAIVYYQLTFPLQLLASRFAAFCLDVLQIPSLREGNLLLLPNYTMEVVEACSGIRSLLSLAALAVVLGYGLEDASWRQVVLVASVVPIAIVSNGLRVVVTGILIYWFGPKTAEGFFHELSGLLVFATAFALMLLVHGITGFRVGRGQTKNAA